MTTTITIPETLDELRVQLSSLVCKRHADFATVLGDTSWEPGWLAPLLAWLDFSGSEWSKSTESDMLQHGVTRGCWDDAWLADVLYACIDDGYNNPMNYGPGAAPDPIENADTFAIETANAWYDALEGTLDTESVR